MIRPAVTCRDLIGRAAEFGFLLDRLSPNDDGPHVVLLRGEAGVGKTRLVREVAAIAGRAGVPVASGTCWELASTAYTPFVETFESLAGAEPSRAAIARAAAETLRGGTPGDAGSDRQRRYLAARDAIAGDDRPRVVVVEDLHWGDAATLDLFAHLARSLPRRGSLLIGTSREDVPEDPLRARGLLELERTVPALLEVRPLNDDEVARLVRTAAADTGRDVPGLVVDDIVRLAEGRPYAAEELLRAYLDGAGDPVVPSSIRLAVAARLGALSEDDRLVLAHAAVIGRRFEVEFLCELLERGAPGVLAALRRARNAQLVGETADGAFLFRHALTRDVVYGELLRAETKRLHRIVASRLERDGADVAIIAEHAWRAADHDGTHRFSIAAGEAAVARHAHADAARFFERAHTTAPDDEARAVYAARAADEQYDLGDLAASLAWIDRAREARVALGDHRAARDLAVRRARTLLEAGRVDDALSEARVLETQLAGAPLDERFESEITLAGLYTTIGRPTDGRRILERLSDCADLGPVASARISAHRASLAANGGDYAEARREFAAAVEHFRAAGERDRLLRTLNNWGDLEINLGDLATARRLTDEGLERARTARAATHLPWLLLNAAQLEIAAGRYAEARAALAAIGARRPAELLGYWWTALRLRLATLHDEPELASLVAEAHAGVEETIASDDRQSLTILAGGLAQHALAHAVDISTLVARALDTLDSAAGAVWLLDAVPVLVPARTAEARAVLERAAAAPENRLAAAHLALFDARATVRRGERVRSRAHAVAAADAFAALGRPYERAVALELAGEAGAALAILREIGATGEARRRTEVGAAKRGTPGESLTAREREIARLIAGGLTNKAIAERLVIGERTVETHVANVLKKLGVTRRSDVSGLIDP